MKQVETIERRSDSLNDIFVRLGKSEKGIEILEAEKYQNQQAIINNKAEMQGYIDKVESRLLEVVKPLVKDVGAIKGYIKYGMGFGGGAFAFLMLLLEIYRTVFKS